MDELISRQATLAAIEQRARDELADANHYYLMGFQDAAETVQNMPSAAHNVHDSAKDADCISRQAAIDAAMECGKKIPPYAIRTKRAIENLPAVIPEPSQVARDIATIIENEKDMRVIAEQRIRCAHCKRYDRHNHRCKWWNHGVSNVDWCSYAVRKDGEAE